jgi:hypothetical protein
MKKLPLLICALMFLASCQNQSGETSTPDAASEPGMTYQLTAFGESPQYSDAAIESYSYNNGTFSFVIAGETYKLGAQTDDAPQKMCANSAQGQHIHVIVDNEPYAAKYEAIFDYEIPDGEHFLLAFLSRSYHESIKADNAKIAQAINVVDKSIESAFDIETPMLFYSRPKGIYVGKAETDKVMLDFYMVNASMDDYQVQAEINDEVHMIDTWQPYYIEGLPMGDNTITLTLLDNEGNVADVPLNPVTRTFTLKADPAEEL